MKLYFRIKLWKWVLANVLRDSIIHNDDMDYAYKHYGIKDFRNNTNHKTGDDITIVVDDIIWRV